jgi:hypothetical protein
MTIVEDARVITGGVDTHAGVAWPRRWILSAGCPASGSSRPPRPGTPVCSAGWAGSGRSPWSGVAGTGSYGAGLARHLAVAGIRVVEVDRAGRQDRHRQGKPDPPDAVSAARAAQSGRAAGAPDGRDGAVEAIRTPMVARRSARHERTPAINQARALIVTGPDGLRARFARHTAGQLAAGLAAMRPRPGEMPGYATRVALRDLGRRARFPAAQIEHPDELIVPLVTARAPGLLALYGIGTHTAAPLPIAAGDHPGRLRSEAARAHLCGAAPIPALAREGHPLAAQPRREPGSQPCPVADRDDPDELPPRHPGLRRPARQGRPVQEGDHPLPETLRRPRGLPLPAPGPLTPHFPGAAWPANRLPHPLAC